MTKYTWECPHAKYPIHIRLVSLAPARATLGRVCIKSMYIGLVKVTVFDKLFVNVMNIECRR